MRRLAPTGATRPLRKRSRSGNWRVREALRSLLPRQRAVLLLKEREGWSVAEIAAGLGWKERQVEYELSKARRALLEWRRRDAGEGNE